MTDTTATTHYPFDAEALDAALCGTALAPWSASLAEAVAARGDANALRHGDLPRWRAALERLPVLEHITARTLDAAVVSIDGGFRRVIDHESDDAERTLRAALAELVPWRKGPFRIGPVTIDCEWRSDRKWDRLAPHIQPLDGRTVLDVGCGSGYHLWRMRGAGAALALGIEPALLFVSQFEALQRYMNDARVAVLPLTLDALPTSMAAFDSVFSMGVLYHRRDPAAHFAELHAALRPGGELVLETLIMPGESDAALDIPGRYARMRNVWTLPSASRVERWLREGGFRRARLVDVDVTSTDEQRRGEWMPHESLTEALDPANPNLTVEGLPRPRRALLLAERPAGTE